MSTIKELLQQTDLPNLERKILLGHVLSKSKAELVKDNMSTVTSAAEQEFKELVARRQNHEPIAYLVGQKEFYGRKFIVNKNVLIPRPESEQLIDLAKASLPQSVLDVGTGSGCLAITIALETNADVTAVDISESALVVAQENNQLHQAGVEFLHSNLLTQIAPGSQFAAIVANLPYISETEIPEVGEETLKYEPRQALFAKAEGLALYEKLFQQIVTKQIQWQNLYCEFGYNQAEQIQSLAKSHFGSAGTVYNDLAGLPRILHLANNVTNITQC